MRLERSSENKISSIDGDNNFSKTRYRTRNAIRSLRCWFIPYLKSRYHRGEFRPLLSYLYTEWRCNVNCYYCYTWNNQVRGMTLEVAKKSIDWLKTSGCRVVAIMGGEPLLRKDFITEVIRYGSSRGFFMYLPTNGILMDRYFIDHAGSAGVAAVNIAVDTIDEKPGLPKSFKRIEPQFKYLVKMKEKYGYIVFFNINITAGNMDDVKELTQIARRYNIGTDYHINEAPVIEQSHYKYGDRGYWITEDYYRKVDELSDWLVEKSGSGYPMVNSVEHLRAMKDFVRHRPPDWKCRAGFNSLVIRTDGTLAPCFELYSSGKDWGSIYKGQRLAENEDLAAQKKECNEKCLSTCNYQVAHYYDTCGRGLQWVLKHAHRGFLEM
ncbi:MAG: radical SAM protein [Deltaproteobacteria bacterium]|nr:radical SAM protein [Deltaproteobacteria bacterium]